MIQGLFNSTTLPALEQTTVFAQRRHELLAGNIANIDTPDYRASRARYYTDVSKMDRNVGTVLEMLQRRGLAENTLFVFTADQGPQWPFGKWGLYDAGVRRPPRSTGAVSSRCCWDGPRSTATRSSPPIPATAR